MKVYLFFALLGIAALSSCRKDYYCTCTNSEGDFLDYSLQNNLTKQQANDQCDMVEVLYSDMDFVCNPEEL